MAVLPCAWSHPSSVLPDILIQNTRRLTSRLFRLGKRDRPRRHGMLSERPTGRPHSALSSRSASVRLAKPSGSFRIPRACRPRNRSVSAGDQSDRVSSESAGGACISAPPVVRFPTSGVAERSL